MEGQSSLRKQAKFSLRILCSSWKILRSWMPNWHPAWQRNLVILEKGKQMKCRYLTDLSVSFGSLSNITVDIALHPLQCPFLLVGFTPQIAKKMHGKLIKISKERILNWRNDAHTCWTRFWAIYCLILKNFVCLQQDLKPWPLRCLCSALTNWARKPLQGSK